MPANPTSHPDPSALAEDLEKLHEAATPGPWVTGLDPRNVCAGPFWIKHTDIDPTRNRQLEANAALVTTLRNALPAILHHLRELASLRQTQAEAGEHVELEETVRAFSGTLAHQLHFEQHGRPPGIMITLSPAATSILRRAMQAAIRARGKAGT